MTQKLNTSKTTTRWTTVGVTTRLEKTSTKWWSHFLRGKTSECQGKLADSDVRVTEKYIQFATVLSPTNMLLTAVFIKHSKTLLWPFCKAIRHYKKLLNTRGVLLYIRSFNTESYQSKWDSILKDSYAKVGKFHRLWTVVTLIMVPAHKTVTTIHQCQHASNNDHFNSRQTFHMLLRQTDKHFIRRQRNFRHDGGERLRRTDN